jgi:PAS domain S-box-containing protein
MPPSDSDQAARLHAILDTAVEAILTIDQRGICESLNRAAERIFGYSAEEVIGHNVSLLMPSPYREQHDGYLANYLESGEKKIIGIGREVVGRRKSGEEFPIYLAVSEVQLADRRLFTGFIQDISAQKEAQRRIVQSERLAVLGEAMARLAHESRNSLQRIQTAVETARLLSETETPLAGQLDAIERASDGLDALFDELKNYAAPLSLDKFDVCLAGVWREAWLSTASHRQGRQAELREVLETERVLCRADRFRMEQVFRNLFENALAACSDPVQVTVTVTETHGAQGPGWEIRVLDNGPGFSEPQAAKIFEPFFTTKSKGTGLGMAIASRIMEAHAGTIRLGSEHAGAELIIEIPQ